jgi:hypothetical protein
VGLFADRTRQVSVSQRQSKIRELRPAVELPVVDRKHRAEMLVAFGVPSLGLLIYLVSLLIRWLQRASS